jgi:dihydroorotate dehydrogenase electron transfer subunit
LDNIDKENKLFQGLAAVISQKELMPRIHLLTIEAPGITAAALPGQFIMITCDSANKRLLRRPISINRVEGSKVDLLYAVIGEGTDWLSLRRAGEQIDILGPMGNGFSIASKPANLLLVAGGMGIAPLCFLAQNALDGGHSVKLLIGAKTSTLVLPKRYLPPGVTTLIATEDGSEGQQGLVTSLLEEQAGWAESIAICGPLPMYKAIYKKYAACLKGKPVEVSLEVRMGCGLGFCYACTINTRGGLKQVCKDGPVFNLKDVIWDELK